MRSTHAARSGSQPFTYEGQCRPPLPSHRALLSLPVNGTNSPAALRRGFHPVAARLSPLGRFALNRSVEPWPFGWPAKTIHQSSPLLAMLASSSSQPYEDVEGSRGSKIFDSLVTSNLDIDCDFIRR